MAPSVDPIISKPGNSNLFVKHRPLCCNIAFFVIASALVLSVSFVAFSSTLGEVFTPLPTHTFSGNATCIIYDRPPRTGSTTISRALRACTTMKAYKHARSYPMSQKEYAVRYMLNSSLTKLTLVSQHVCMLHDDIQRLENRCGSLFHITSTNGVKDRILSNLKYRFLSTNGNSTITKEHVDRMKKIIKRGTEPEEDTYEKYPYCHNRLPMRPAYAIPPDYVIRSNHMVEDLLSLLEAFGCVAEFDTRNVHTSPFDMEELMSSIKLKHDDRSHKLLSKMAETINKKGLEKALSF